MVKLGDSSGLGALPADPWAAAVDSRGRYYVVMAEPSKEPPWVFDARGKFLQRLGGVGAGPGEYREPRLVLVGRADTIIIFDYAQPRMTILTADYRVVATTEIPRSVRSATQLRDGRFVLNAEVNDRARIGMAYHLFARDGKYVSSFGDTNTRISPQSQPSRRVRWLASARQGGFWSIPWTHRYGIEHWSAEGQRTLTLTPTRDWFVPYDTLLSPSATRPPFPALFNLWEDDSGLLWVLGRAAAPDWAQGLGAPARREGQDYYPNMDYRTVYDGVIDVYDPRAGTLVATKRFPDPINLAFGNGLVASIDEDANGTKYLRVWRVQLKRP